jgi:hypothetical protein
MENIEKKVEETKDVVVVKKAAAPKKAEVKVKSLILKNSSGQEVKTDDYFFKGIIPSGFEGTCGKPVEREDLLGVFNKVFKPTDNILFYKQNDKEVYLIIIPLKYSDSVGEEHDSMDGDFQKHAISFLTEGSVNLDTLRQKLEKIKKFVKYNDR